MEEKKLSLTNVRAIAEQGDAEAQFNLGRMFNYGEGVQRNDVESLKWFLKAAEQGHTGAQFNLGRMYDHGEGAPRNNAESVKWYFKAARQGHEEAQLALWSKFMNEEIYKC